LPYSYLYLIGLLPALASALLVAIFPALRRPTPILVLGILCGAAFFRRELPAAVLETLIMWILIGLITRIPAKQPRSRALRWRYASLLMIATLGYFFLMDWFFPVRFGVTIRGVMWIIYGHQMMLFLRLVSLVWEVGVGRVTAVPLQRYFQWVLFPCTLEALVWRFSDFEKQYPRMLTEGRPALPPWWRWLGVLACIQLAAAVGLQRWNDHFYIELHQRPLLVEFCTVFFAAPWMLYLLNAGSTNAMRSAGTFWNVELPPGYERPFGRVNISEFWAHYNMTVTLLFRDMVFFNRWGLKKMNPYFNVVVVFVLIGLWHKTNLHYLVWGLLNGFGFAVYLWWRSNLRLTGIGSRLGLTPAVARFASAAFTYVFICTCDYLAGRFHG
jgi:D-alanyl-lipoteichoic acid acyltransferase DltB (MBOAT superfamily)